MGCFEQNKEIPELLANTVQTRHDITTHVGTLLSMTDIFRGRK